jgi:cytochrome c-type biogenesis protein CcmE
MNSDVFSVLVGLAVIAIAIMLFLALVDDNITF